VGGVDEEWEYTADEINSISEPDFVHETRAPYDSGKPGRRGYRELRVWQMGMQIVAEAYRLSGAFPQSELYGLTSQLRRAANSIPLNIAEGWGKNTRLELARGADIARGSLAETDTALEIAVLLEFLRAEELVEVSRLADQPGGMLYRLSETLRNRS
jgi:four helix bundle protein